MTNSNYEYATYLVDESKKVSENIATLKEIRASVSDETLRNQDFRYVIEVSAHPMSKGKILKITDYDMECFIKHEEDVLKDLNNKFAKI